MIRLSSYSSPSSSLSTKPLIILYLLLLHHIIPIDNAPIIPILTALAASAAGLFQIQIDTLHIAKYIRDASQHKRNRAAFVRDLLYTAFYRSGQQYNVIVFNLAEEHQQQLFGVSFYGSVAFSTDGTRFGIWVFEHGTFHNHGARGWHNWGMIGTFTKSPDGSVIYFSRRKRLHGHGLMTSTAAATSANDQISASTTMTSYTSTTVAASAYTPSAAAATNDTTTVDPINESSTLTPIIPSTTPSPPPPPSSTMTESPIFDLKIEHLQQVPGSHRHVPDQIIIISTFESSNKSIRSTNDTAETLQSPDVSAKSTQPPNVTTETTKMIEIRPAEAEKPSVNLMDHLQRVFESKNFQPSKADADDNDDKNEKSEPDEKKISIKIDDRRKSSSSSTGKRRKIKNKKKKHRGLIIDE